MDRVILDTMEKLGKAIDDNESIEVEHWKPSSPGEVSKVWKEFSFFHHTIDSLKAVIEQGRIGFTPEPRFVYVNVYESMEAFAYDEKDHAMQNCRAETGDVGDRVLLEAHPIELPDSPVN